MSMESMPQGSSFLRAASEGGGEEYDLGDGRRGSIEMPDLEAWPRGIIKTVSVEVVEEHNPDHVPHAAKEITGPSRDGAGDRNSGGSAVEQDWEAMLRAGPPVR